VRVRETAQPLRTSADTPDMLDYERLDVYQCALQFAALSFQVLEKLPRGHGELSDQLRRATISVPLNIAEGAGKTTERERARYHAIARGSAMECAAIVDLLRLQALVDPETATAAKALCVRIVSMLSRMCR
jgi:four helix bundle protein